MILAPLANEAFFVTWVPQLCLIIKIINNIFSEAKAGLEIVPVFISVDPERDNVEQVSEYVKGLQLFFVCHSVRECHSIPLYIIFHILTTDILFDLDFRISPKFSRPDWYFR